MAFNLCVAEAGGAHVAGGMASFGSLRCMFEQPSADKANLLETLTSWKHQIIPVVRKPSCTEIFGEMHFDEVKSDSVQPLPLFLSAPAFSVSFRSVAEETTDVNTERDEEVGADEELEGESSFSATEKKTGEGSVSFEEMNDQSLQMCTEGLGSESSSNDVELDMRVNAMQASNDEAATKTMLASWIGYGDEGDRSLSAVADSRRWPLKAYRGRKEKGFPPPISSIGKSGRPSVSFRSYREEGRFVLKEVKNPAQEFFLHASREDGRLTLKFVQPEDDDDGEDHLRWQEDGDESSQEDDEDN